MIASPLFPCLFFIILITSCDYEVYPLFLNLQLLKSLQRIVLCRWVDFSEGITPLGCIPSPHHFGCQTYLSEILLRFSLPLQSICRITGHGICQIWNRMCCFLCLQYGSSLRIWYASKREPICTFYYDPFKPLVMSKLTSSVKSLPCLLHFKKATSNLRSGNRNMKQKQCCIFDLQFFFLHSSVMNQSLNTSVMLSSQITFSPCCAV